MSRQILTNKGGVITTTVVAGAVGVGVWLSTLFGGPIVSMTSSCTSSCSGNVTLSAQTPRAATSVVFKSDGVTIGTASMVSPGQWTFLWNTASASNGSHSVTVTASNAAGSASTSGLTISTSNAVGGNANVWIATTGSDTCTRNAAAVSYTAAVSAGNVCATFNRAYSISSQGDAVLTEAGVYPDQTISATSKSGAGGNCRLTFPSNGTLGTFTETNTGCVTFEPAPGAAVTVGCKTTTTAYFNTNSADPKFTGNTIPIADATGCQPMPGQSYYNVVFNFNGGQSFHCTGLSASSGPANLTGCGIVGGSCGLDAPNQSGLPCFYNSGATVTIGGVKISSSYVRVKGLTISGQLSITSGVTDVIADGVTATGGSWSGTWSSLENSTTGDSNDVGGRLYFASGDSHNYIYKSTNENSGQSGCTQNVYCHASNVYLVSPVDFAYVDSTTFGGCGSGNFFSSNDQGPGALGPFTIIGSYFGPVTCAGQDVLINLRSIANGITGAFHDYTIEGNTSTTPWQITVSGTTATAANFLISGNVGVVGGTGTSGTLCNPATLAGFSSFGATMQYNVDAGTACSSASNPVANNNTGGQSFPGLFVDATHGDLDLTSTPSWATNPAWACSSTITVDHNGTTRTDPCTPGGYQG